jgi:FKBP-type peptidyl-prolyl cis-trans isomerase FklB
MQKLLQLFLSFLVFGSLLQSTHAQTLESGMDTISYCVGMMVAQSVKKQVGDIRYEAFMDGLKTVMEDGESMFTDAQAQEYLNAFGAAKQKAKFESQIKEGESFLAENGKRAEVITLENGMQYEVLVAGPEDGQKPAATDRVKVHYHGTLINGEVFDSSVDKGVPIDFGVREVIKGWTEILQLMTVGSKWKVYIPEDLAYGARGKGSIQPYTTLVFEIELIEVL